MHISPSNISEITLALFYITNQEVRKEYAAKAVDLMDKLTTAWNRCEDSDQQSKTKTKTLIRAAKKVVSILKPAAKERIKQQTL